MTDPHALVPAGPSLSPALLADLEAAQRFADQDSAASTRRAYQSDWRRFTGWCAGHELAPLPASPAVVAAFLAAEAGAGKKAATLGRRLAAIRAAHLRAGHEPPSNSEAVRATLRGIRRTVGTRAVRKAPVPATLVRALADQCDVTTLIGLRDRALLLLGFAGALRRSELVALQVADLEFTSEGVLLSIRRSKADQEGRGQTVAVPSGTTHCPVAALRAWLTAAEVGEGPVFRAVWKGGRRVRSAALSEGVVATIVKAHVGALGHDPAKYGAHSLRAGLLTSAAQAGKSVWKMRAQSRHASMEMVAVYVRDEERFSDNAASGLL